MVCMTGELGFDSLEGQEIFLSSTVVPIGCGAHPATYPVGIGALFPGVKRPGREVDHTLSSSEVENVVKLYLQFSIRRDGVLLNYAPRDLFTCTLPGIQMPGVQN
jgi:hypothetical protein